MTAFTVDNFDRLSASVNTDINAVWMYTDTSNTLATMEASGFFNNVNQSTTNPLVNIKDGIRIVGSDGVDMVYVTAISPNITVSVQVDIPASTITTAMLQDLSVTTAKIDTNSVTLAKLASGVTPGYILKTAISGTFSGGSASTTLSNSLIDVGDLVVIWLTGCTNAAAVGKVVVTSDQAVINFTTDPGSNTTYIALVFRAVS